MTIILLIAGLLLAFIGAIVAATSKGAEKFLWGSLILSIGLGFAVCLAGAGYLGVLIVSAFLACDLIIYLFYNSIDLQTEKIPENKKTERFFKTFLIWVLSYLAFLCVVKIWELDEKISLFPLSESFNGIQLLQGAIWQHNWVIVLIAMLSMIVMAIGGFMLVRKDK